MAYIDQQLSVIQDQKDTNVEHLGKKDDEND
jgi:hypothetical protein